jgi:hypothetical protein
MHSISPAGEHGARENERQKTTAARQAPVRVGVAGATGYTGQELLRILAKHPGVQLVAATSSGATAARRLPALSRIWTGTITPLEPDTLAREAELVFLALPDTGGGGARAASGGRRRPRRRSFGRVQAE